MAKTKTQQPYHERVAEEVIKALEAGTAPWIQPWKAGDRPERPINALTGQAYKGWNSIYLNMKQQGDDARWCTYKQAAELGAQVRKGEKGSVIQYWQFNEKRLLKDDQGKPLLDAEGNKQYKNVVLDRPKVFHAVVFNAAQIDGLPPLPPRKEIPEWQRHEQAESLLTQSKAVIIHDQNNTAFYRPSTDQIHLPPKGQFENADQYYATALHELGHWTGHASRLNRDLSHPFGSEAYAKEELRAEIASYMLGTELGTGHDPGQHMTYIKSWIKVLKEDPMEIFRASRDAQQIMDYVQNFGQQQVIEQAANQQEVSNTQEVKVMEPATKTEETAVSQRISTEKTWLKVPYAQKNKAKQHGAKWDRSVKSWYAPEGTDLAPLQPWLQSANSELQDPPLDPQTEFANALKAAGLQLEGTPKMDGELHRVPVEGDDKGLKSGAYKGFLDGHPAGFIQNFKTGLKTNWKATGQNINAAEVARLEKIAEAKRIARSQERQAAFETKANELMEEWQKLPDAPPAHSYLKQKQLSYYDTSFGAKLDAKGNLVVPLQDTQGKLWSLQRISINGQKGFEKNGRVAGCFHVIGGREAIKQMRPGEPLLISTGFATAATVHLATNRPVVAVLQDSNLKEVAQNLKQQFPQRQIIIFGDDDRHLPKRVPPLPNSGREKAEEAATVIQGKAVFPRFMTTEQGSEFTDFADLKRVRGLEAVKQQLLLVVKSRPKTAIEKLKEARAKPSKGLVYE